MSQTIFAFESLHVKRPQDLIFSQNYGYSYIGTLPIKVKYTFFYKKILYNKMSLKNSKSLRKCSENLQPQMPELQFLMPGLLISSIMLIKLRPRQKMVFL